VTRPTDGTPAVPMDTITAMKITVNNVELLFLREKKEY